MRQIAGMRSVVATLPPLLAIALAGGCGWRETMHFESPSGKAVVEIMQTRVANEWGIRVRLLAEEKARVLYERHGETLIYFVHVYWSPDESKVAVLATGSLIFKVAFDLRNDKRLPFEDLRSAVGDSIRKAYHLPVDKDPIYWAASDGQFAFWKLHPEIKVSYH